MKLPFNFILSQLLKIAGDQLFSTGLPVELFGKRWRLKLLPEPRVKVRQVPDLLPELLTANDDGDGVVRSVTR